MGRVARRRAVLGDGEEDVIEVDVSVRRVAVRVHGLGLETVPDADAALMVLAHKGILDLTLALNALLPQASEHARHAADRAAAMTCTALAAELGDCYTGRLKTFLNPLGRPPATTSAVIRTQPRHGSRRRGPASGKQAPAPDAGR